MTFRVKEGEATSMGSTHLTLERVGPRVDHTNSLAPNLQELRSLIKTAHGVGRPDLVLRGCRVLNVHTGEVYPADISISGRYIAQVKPHLAALGQQELDCNGLLALPGYIEPHMHVESSLVSPLEFAKAVVPLGTTTVFLDPHEIANVFGLEGVKELIKACRGLPLRPFIQAPSRVPSAPGMETTGGVLEIDHLIELAKVAETVTLGEIDPSKILSLNDEYLERIVHYRSVGKLVNGHSGGVMGDDLNAFVAAGVFDDHSQKTEEALLERLRFGVTAFVVETSDRRLAAPLLRIVSERGFNTRHICHDIDDKDIGAILEEGFLDHNIRAAMSAGVDPAHAVEMATLNPATYYGLDSSIGSVTPGRLADIVLVEQIGKSPPRHVVFQGELVASDGELVQELTPYEFPSWFRHSISLHPSINQGRLGVPTANRSIAQVRVIIVSDTGALNKAGTAELAVRDGAVQPDPSNDILKMCVFERYGKNGNVGVAFAQGFGLKAGAVGSSICHDHHNIVVVGTNDEDIMCAAHKLEEIQGGWVVVRDGNEVSRLQLDIGGLMTDRPFRDVARQKSILTNLARSELGSTRLDPLSLISFTCLSTVPAYGLSDMGLIDVRTASLVDVVMSS